MGILEGISNAFVLSVLADVKHSLHTQYPVGLHPGSEPGQAIRKASDAMAQSCRSTHGKSSLIKPNRGESSATLGDVTSQAGPRICISVFCLDGLDLLLAQQQDGGWFPQLGLALQTRRQYDRQTL